VIDPQNYGVNDQSTREITAAELDGIQNRIKNMPDGIRRLEPVDQRWRAVRKLNGETVYLNDELNVGIVKNYESEMGTAWSRGNSMYIHSEFIGTPIQDHEYIHTLTFRNKILKDGLQDQYSPPSLWQHAEGAQNRMGEHFTMTMTAYSEDRSAWIDNIMKIEPASRITREDAEKQINAIEKLLKGIGAW